MTRAERLHRERGAWLCTLRPDGSPHVTPVWFVHDDGVWWVGSRSTNVKVRNVAADRRVSLTLEDTNRPVVAEGLADVLHSHEFPASVVDGFITKYDWNPTLVDASGAPRVLLRIAVRRWLLG